MTAKPSAKKKSTRSPSQAELKRQAAAQKAENDALKARLAELEALNKEPESLVVPNVDMDQEPPEESLISEDDSIPGIDTRKKDQEAIPEKKSSYTYDEIMDLVAHHQRKNAGPDIHVKNYQNAIEASEMHRGDESAVESDVDAYNNVRMIKVSKDFDPKNPAMVEKHANEVFMRDRLLVKILDTNEKNAAGIFSVSVNGREVLFKRGEQKWVPRYIVEGLARAKPITYGNEEYTAADGTRAVRHPKSIGLRYPFAVLSDPHPRGPDWLAHVIAQP